MSELATALQSPSAYPHDVAAVVRRETHISWVFLAGEFAYKVKKPVDFGFIDFSTLERRRRFCHEELRLNGRFADDLYLDVVPIVTAGNGVKIDGDGTPIEYAVRMRRFDEDQLASHLLAHGAMQPADVDDLADAVARFHVEKAIAGDANRGTEVAAPMRENFTVLRSLSLPEEDQAELDAAEGWMNEAVDRLAPIYRERAEQQFVRQCHGDLHLGNIVRWRGTMTPFDCIEFNPDLQWIDVMGDVAFLVMDFDDHDRPDFGARFLNGYLERTGDYAGLAVLTPYLAYRAMVRAKVDGLRLSQSGLSSKERRHLKREWRGYVKLARRYAQPRQVSLTITHGFSGSGKTTGTQHLLEREGAIRIRSDVERKRMFGLNSEAAAQTAINTGLYSESATQRTYERLTNLARNVISAGFPAIVDATFLRRAQREQFQEMAAALGVPFRIAAFHEEPNILRARIAERRGIGRDASDATAEVLEHQLKSVEPLDPSELACVISPA